MHTRSTTSQQFTSCAQFIFSMRVTVWCILVAVLLILADAGCYNEGSRSFCYPASDNPKTVHDYETKDVLLYLTPSQVQVLEAMGFMVRPERTDAEHQYVAENEQIPQDVENRAFKQNIEQEWNNNAHDHKSKELLELQEIFKIVDIQMEEDAKTIRRGNKPKRQRNKQIQDSVEVNKQEDVRGNLHSKQVKDQGQFYDNGKQRENFEEIPNRFGVLGRYIAPPVQKQTRKKHKTAYRHPILNHRKQERLQQEVNKRVEAQEVKNMEADKFRLRDKHKLIVTFKENTEQNKNEEKVDSKKTLKKDNNTPLTTILDNHNGIQPILQNRGQLNNNDLVQLSKYKNTNNTIESKKTTLNMGQQNAIATAEVFARIAPFLSEEQFDAKNVEGDNNNEKTLLTRPSNPVDLTLSLPHPYRLVVVRPIPVPVIKNARIALITPLPVETENISVGVPKKVHVPIGSLYLERVDPVEFNKQLLFSEGKTKDSTIVRHVWEH